MSAEATTPEPAAAWLGLPYDLTWSTVDDGADAFSTGSGYELSATIG